MTDRVAVNADVVQGLAQAVLPSSLAATAVAVVIGLVVGMIPGMTISSGIIIVLPLTFVLDLNVSIALFLALQSSPSHGRCGRRGGSSPARRAADANPHRPPHCRGYVRSPAGTTTRPDARMSTHRLHSEDLWHANDDLDLLRAGGAAGIVVACAATKVD